MAKNPQPQLPRSTGTGIRSIPGTSAEAVKIPPLLLLLSPFASTVENYLGTHAYRKIVYKIKYILFVDNFSITLH